MPKVMGVLTHLDQFQKTRQIRKTKKELKHRFWTEIYAGAKLFYLSGIMYGKYQKVRKKGEKRERERERERESLLCLSNFCFCFVSGRLLIWWYLHI